VIAANRERILTGFILLFYVVFAVTFSVGPIFEAPDEREHYEYIHVLAHDHTFPDATTPLKEFSQPPLYYFLASPLVMLLGDGDFDTVAARLNPYRYIHGETGWYQLGNDNKNVYLHTRAEQFPYADSETARAVHLLRLISVGLGLVTLVIAYKIFRLMWPHHPLLRLLALGILATWPQFVYATSAISNDVLLIALLTTALWLGLRIVHEEPSWKMGLGLGVVLGAALLTKFSALVVAAVVILPLVVNRRGWRVIPSLALSVIVLSGWWYARNWQRYGDPTGMAAMYKSWPDLRLSKSVSFSERLDRAAFIYSSFWALLGTSTIAVHKSLYVFYDAVTTIALSGLGLRIIWRIWHALPHAPDHGQTISSEEHWRNRAALFFSVFPRSLRATALCGLLALALVAATIGYTFQNSAGNQGRFLFPGIAAWGVLLALGLSAWSPERWQRFVIPLWLAAFGVAAIISGYDVYRAYYIPGLPEHIAHPIHYTFEGYAELLGVEPDIVHAHPDDLVTITLYWRALRPSEKSELLVYIHSVGSTAITRDTYPATGNLIATDWEPGATWTERHIIRVPPDVKSGHVYPLVAGLYDPDTHRPLTAINANGEETTPIIGRVAINAPPGKIDTAYRFADRSGNLIALALPEIVQIGEQIHVCLTWRAERQPPVDLALFVHLLDGTGNLITQYDGPAGGDYPTGAWTRGEVVNQCVLLTASDLPSDAQIALGLYYLDDFTRLTVRDVAGNALGDMVKMRAFSMRTDIPEMKQSCIPSST
jgi:hypothetical protein